MNNERTKTNTTKTDLTNNTNERKTPSSPQPNDHNLQQHNQQQLPNALPQMKGSKSHHMCSSQPRFTEKELNDLQPRVNQNKFRINVKLYPRQGTQFSHSNCGLGLRTLFTICKNQDPTFTIIGWNLKESKVNDITSHTEIPLDYNELKAYIYNPHIAARYCSISLVVCTKFSFQRMFKSRKGYNGHKSIMDELDDKKIYINKTDVETMGTTKYIGFLLFSHPTLSNQQKALEAIRNITGTEDITLENYRYTIWKNEINDKGESKRTPDCSTIAYFIGAPEDISSDMAETLAEKWIHVKSGDCNNYDATSNMKKLLFVPLDRKLLSESDLKTYMKEQNTFRFFHKGIMIKNMTTVDNKFKITAEECKKLGLDENNTPRDITVRQIIHSWKLSDDSDAVWAIEPAGFGNNRQNLLVGETSITIVQQELSNLMELLRARQDFEKITGSNISHIDGQIQLGGKASSYQKMLQHTAIYMKEKQETQFPGLPLQREKKKKQKKVWNPYNTATKYADVLTDQERNIYSNQTNIQKRQHNTTELSTTTSEKTTVNSNITTLTTNQNTRHNTTNNDNMQIEKAKSTAITTTKSQQETMQIERTIQRFEDYRQMTEARFQETRIEMEKRDKQIQQLIANQKQTIEKMDTTITAKIQPHTEKLSSMTMAINNIKHTQQQQAQQSAKLEQKIETSIKDSLREVLAEFAGHSRISDNTLQVPFPLVQPQQHDVNYSHLQDQQLTSTTMSSVTQPTVDSTFNETNNTTEPTNITQYYDANQDMSTTSITTTTIPIISNQPNTPKRSSNSSPQGSKMAKKQQLLSPEVIIKQEKIDTAFSGNITENLNKKNTVQVAELLDNGTTAWTEVPSTSTIISPMTTRSKVTTKTGNSNNLIKSPHSKICSRNNKLHNEQQKQLQNTSSTFTTANNNPINKKKKQPISTRRTSQSSLSPRSKKTMPVRNVGHLSPLGNTAAAKSSKKLKGRQSMLRPRE